MLPNACHHHHCRRPNDMSRSVYVRQVGEEASWPKPKVAWVQDPKVNAPFNEVGSFMIPLHQRTRDQKSLRIDPRFDRHPAAQTDIEGITGCNFHRVESAVNDKAISNLSGFKCDRSLRCARIERGSVACIALGGPPCDQTVRRGNAICRVLSKERLDKRQKHGGVENADGFLLKEASL